MKTTETVGVVKLCLYKFNCLLQTEQFAVLWLLFTVIVVGNSAVLAGLTFGKHRKSRMNFFIKQLAFAGESKRLTLSISNRCFNTPPRRKYLPQYHCILIAVSIKNIFSTITFNPHGTNVPTLKMYSKCKKLYTVGHNTSFIIYLYTIFKIHMKTMWNSWNAWKNHWISNKFYTNE